MNLTEEEFEQFVEASAKKFKEDTQFLIQEGWIKTDKKGFADFTLLIHYQEIEEECEQHVCFIHPTSKRVYIWNEAVDIARFNNMQDLPLDCCCKKTNQIQKIIDEQKIVPFSGMTLFLDFVLEDKKTHFYKLHNDS